MNAERVRYVNEVSGNRKNAAPCPPLRCVFLDGNLVILITAISDFSSMLRAMTISMISSISLAAVCLYALEFNFTRIKLSLCNIDNKLAKRHVTRSKRSEAHLKALFISFYKTGGLNNWQLTSNYTAVRREPYQRNS
jgi:hypothetical protein